MIMREKPLEGLVIEADGHGLGEVAEEVVNVAVGQVELTDVFDLLALGAGGKPIFSMTLAVLIGLRVPLGLST